MYFLLKSGISLIILYLFYLVFLKKDTWFNRNRWFLLTSILFSMVLPFIHFQLKSNAPGVLHSFLLQGADTVPSGEGVLSSRSWDPVLLVYISGVMFTLSILVFRILQIFRLAYRLPVENRGTFLLIKIPGNRPAFSFFKWIFLPANLPNTDEEKIISHEIKHINYHHTADMLLAELLCVFQWFNPVTWLYKFTLKEIHEYSADEHVLSEGVGRLVYQNLIMKQVFGLELFPLGNHFNNSLIKKRIIMMTKNKSPKINHFKLLVMLPVSLALIFSLSFSITDSGNQHEPSNELNKVSSFQKDTTTAGIKFLVVEDMPVFKGKDQEKFSQWIARHLKYPEIAVKNGISGKVFVNFVVEKNGTISHVKVVRGVDPALDAEAVRVIKSSPKWTPGKQRGKRVKVSLTFPINFVLK